MMVRDCLVGSMAALAVDPGSPAGVFVEGQHTAFILESGGRWSGGGRAAVDNLAEAVALANERAGGALRPSAVIPRNVVSAQRLWQGGYLLMPQNALPWLRKPLPLRIEKHRALLLAGSLASATRARRMLRISSAIPDLKGNGEQPIHNVLDRQFEADLATSDSLVGRYEEEWGDAVVVPGTVGSYKNTALVLRAFRAYERSGGPFRLLLVGPPATPGIQRLLRQRIPEHDGVSWVPRSVDRPALVALLRASAAVLLPSCVEASPITLMEAVAVAKHVIASDLVGHTELLAPYRHNVRFFDPRSSGALKEALLTLDRGYTTDTDPQLTTTPGRAAIRQRWVERVASWLLSSELEAGEQ